MKKLMLIIAVFSAAAYAGFSQVESRQFPKLIEEINTALDTKQSSSLASNKFLIGNASGVAAAQSITGPVLINYLGVSSITNGAIVADNIAAGVVSSAKCDIAVAASLLNADKAYVTANAASASAADAQATADAASASAADAQATADAASATAAAAVAGDTISFGVSVTANEGTCYVTNSLAAKVHMVAWLSATAGGPATDTDLTSIAVDGNSTLLSAADSPTIVFVCHTDGKTTFTITTAGIASINRYINIVQRNGVVKSSPVMAIPNT